MGAERRRASRVPINVTLSLNGISDENDACEQKDISVETVDISKGGIAFITKKTLKKGTFTILQFKCRTMRFLMLLLK